VTRRSNWLVNLARRFLGAMVIREAPGEVEQGLDATDTAFDAPVPDEEIEKGPEQPDRHGEARH
jgi:hypothetical protein